MPKSLLLFILKSWQDELVHLKSSLLDLGTGKDDKRMQRRATSTYAFLFFLKILTRDQS